MVTIAAIEYSNTLVNCELAYCPITLCDDVSHTCRNTVSGNCKLRTICEISSPWNGSPMKKISSKAMPIEAIMPTCECVSFTWYGSPNMPAEIEPDDSNTFDYVDGWNACRAAMLKGDK